MQETSEQKPDEPELDAPRSQSLVSLVDQPPTVVPAVLLDDLVPFPGAIVPVLLENPERRDAALYARKNHGFFLLINRRNPSAESPSEITVQPKEGDEPAAPAPSDNNVVSVDDLEKAIASDDVEIPPDQSEPTQPRQVLQLADLNPMGVMVRLIKVFKLPDGRLSALVQLLRRAEPVEVLYGRGFPMVRVVYPGEVMAETEVFKAILQQLRSNLQQFFNAHAGIPEEVKVAAMSIEGPGPLSDFVAQHLARDYRERIGFLNELDLGHRVMRALEVVVRELDLLNVGNRITQDIREKVEKHQRDFFLREQLKAIRTELGEEQDPASLAIKELRQKLDEAGLPPEARERADDELKRLELVPTESPEHNVVRSYLEWIANLPWSRISEDTSDIAFARKVLDQDHYGLEEVKDRIIEFLAVRQLNPEKPGSIMCLAGPPGVGKTSLGQSIARALGRKFYRFSVGGMRDEAEVKGHRRTYVGAMPGRILQGLKQVGVANPVFMLDEIDKMGADWRGDPSSAMLEVLDPAQNNQFLDHYLDLSFDLSRVMFIATANVKTEIPDPLLDRMEVIDLPGYIPEEKLEIAARYLSPRQRKLHGLTARDLRVGRPALRRIIREYTHEAGVRELERQIAKICRKRATQVVSRAPKISGKVTASDVETWLGSPKIHDDRIGKRPPPGVVLGLAWTAVGGDILFIEVARMPGKGVVKVTGQLGDVMTESANLAVSYVKSRAQELGIDTDIFKDHDIHLHFPAGAVKKDGPSAGVTVTTALISLLRGRSIRPRVAMTGEMTLRGEVLPVGGIREKVVAARRAGVREVIVPERNRADVEEIPDFIRKHIRVHYARTYADVYEAAFAEERAPHTASRAKPLGRLAARSSR